MSLAVKNGTAILAISVLGGCSDPLRLECLYAPPLFEVEVVDATSGRPAAYGAVVIVSRGEVADTNYSEVAAGDSLSISRVIAGASRSRDEPGTYNVRVERQGFVPWVADGVLVPAGPCNEPRTVRLTATLVPLP
jgi:hypothetical protein